MTSLTTRCLSRQRVYPRVFEAHRTTCGRIPVPGPMVPCVWIFPKKDLPKIYVRLRFQASPLRSAPLNDVSETNKGATRHLLPNGALC